MVTEEVCECEGVRVRVRVMVRGSTVREWWRNPRW